MSSGPVTLLNGPVWLPPHVRRALDRPACDIRHPEFRAAWDACRSGAAQLLGADGWTTVLASGSGTFGMELVLRSVIAPGDRAIAVVCGTFGERGARMAELAGAEVTRLAPPPGEVPTPDAVGEAVASHRARWLVVAHVEPSTATQVDLRGVAAAAARAGATVVVDGVCSGFALDVPCASWGIGAFVTASQKGLALPPGMAIAVISPELMERAERTPLERTGLSGHLSSWIEPRFTPPVAHVFAMAASLAHIQRETLPERDARHRRQAAEVRAWGRRMDLDPVPLAATWAADTLSAFYYPPGCDDAWLLRMRDERGVEMAPSNDARLPGRYFRIGHLGDLPDPHLDAGLARLTAALEEARR